jgi:ferredoxin
MSRLAVDPIACTGHGICAEMLPELIGLDEWGYPILAEREVPKHLAALARRAARLCPTLAIRLAEADAERKSPTRGPYDPVSARGRYASNEQQAGPR